MTILTATQPAAVDYYEQGYWRTGDLWEEFVAHVRTEEGKTALHAGEQSMTYGELEQAALEVSARLRANGVRRGELVILMGRNSIEAAAALLGCFHRGAVAAPVPPIFGREQLSALISQAGARGIVAFGGDTEIEKCRAVSDQVSFLLALPACELAQGATHDRRSRRRSAHPDDVTVVLHSSGTTSTPKGIMHSSNTLRYATEQVLRRWELVRDDIHLVVCEFGFVGSLVFGYLPVLLSGATGVLLTRWDADDALRLIEQHRCTYVLFMPTHGADAIVAGRQSARDWSSLRVLAAPGLSRTRRADMQEIFGLPPLADYGLSEVPGHVSHGLHERPEKILTTEGRPFPGTEVRIQRPDGERAAPGEVGAVVVNGPSRFLGFLGNDELTRTSLTAWGGYMTGDLGYLDEDGDLVYAGRSKDIIRRGGITIVPAEVEPVVARHPAVHEVAVVPLPDDRLGERACAAMILKSGAVAPTLRELQEFLAGERLAKYLWPESIEVFEDFPRTSSLKAVKRDIVKQILERTSVAASSP